MRSTGSRARSRRTCCATSRWSCSVRAPARSGRPGRKPSSAQSWPRSARGYSRSLADDFEITALSTSRRESADAAGELFSVPAAFDNHQELVNSPAVDVVAVTVKVPYHLELATAGLEAGKAVYCEWPFFFSSRRRHT